MQIQFTVDKFVIDLVNIMSTFEQQGSKYFYYVDLRFCTNVKNILALVLSTNHKFNICTPLFLTVVVLLRCFCGRFPSALNCCGAPAFPVRLTVISC